ncbi:polyprenyl synthetase family protein [Arthrospira platensis FACHB-971]|jgi:geranylgeranyl diphosphate synthase type II|uniref:Polyprenyl synthetase family protein n=1 Tax=Limnospira platensis NIES-46 TaxID=1236695 RepID=A0A5M3T2E9_LIMPL|nr:polyprenyl synthetase family protein [Arthrospira platensis]AMW29615.1 polyprenyl synthetase [Arthrospira platensis YZ]MBD2571739.1 polyprenyl synthetase family protein [Arthrospira platensis FACHB-971]MBD2668202.1 polyprenyl synthetase family protein [Arthrospira platensis FACHB-439]MBD2708762.1 polyprenyl synthetase family protein [Arthrospira platensis FACHB-835]MDT9181624.1 polyprenyl synthetase family protein [Limnospira sp. PMC 289.06]BAI92014.1 polyprenyl synthetase family protein [
MFELLLNWLGLSPPSNLVFWGILLYFTVWGILLNLMFLGVKSDSVSDKLEKSTSSIAQLGENGCGNGKSVVPFLPTEETDSAGELQSCVPQTIAVSNANGDVASAPTRLTVPLGDRTPQTATIAVNDVASATLGDRIPDGKNNRGSILPEDANLEADLNIVSEAILPTSEPTQFDKTIINQALEDSRIAIGAKIQEFIGRRREIIGSYEPLYDLLLDYPFRGGKMLRPTMCISAARAMGGMGQVALSTAAALELYHNAFLIHDDIEDGSESRRGKGTLHHNIGIPRAINVGDATNVLAVGLLLENLSAIGVTKTLNVLHEIEFMARQSVEGQAMELDWVAENTQNLSDRDYFKMCVKKTCWYSFMTPCRIGLIVGNSSANPQDLVEPLAGVTRFGMILGIAFQIQDDLLNLVGDMKAYGKEIGGDIYEGKRTLMLNHAIAHSSPVESRRMLEILATPRPEKTPEQVEFVMEKMRQYGSIEHGWAVARSLAQKAAQILDSLDFMEPKTPLRPGEKWQTPVHDRRFLKELINYVIYRNL